jgi:hypothetical protein
VTWIPGGVDVTDGVQVAKLQVAVTIPTDTPQRQQQARPLSVTVRVQRNQQQSDACVRVGPLQESMTSSPKTVNPGQITLFEFQVGVTGDACPTVPQVSSLVYTATYSLDFGVGNHFLNCLNADPAWPDPTPDNNALRVRRMAPQVTVTIQAIVAVSRDGEIDAPVTLNGAQSASVNFTVQTSQNMGTGQARLVDAGGNLVASLTKTITTTDNKVKIRGVTESSQVDNIQLTATVSGSSDTEDFTVVAIQRAEWVQLMALLDANPHPTAPIGQRIFPEDADIPQFGSVYVRATITPAVAGVTVFFRSIDVDDPSANASPVDEDTNTTAPNYAKDNRGIDDKDGLFIVFGNAVGNETSVETTASGQALATFQMTMKPGDNFRVVATCLDQNASNPTIDLTGVQAIQNDGNMSTGMARVKDAMGNIIPGYIANPGQNQQQPAPAAVMASDVLTVWRKLHVEVDSMTAIPAGTNAVNGNITRIVPIQTSIGVETRIFVNQNLNDGSPDPGRFENGTIRIGNGNPSQVGWNGSDYVHGREFDIPFVIRKSGLPDLRGRVVLMDPDTRTFGLLMIGKLTSSYSGGTITVASVPMEIENITGVTTLTVKQLLPISFVLTDDDTAIMPHSLNTDLVDDAFAHAYVDAIIDGGDNRNNNTQDVPFKLNVGTKNDEVVAAQDWDSKGSCTDNYWVVYLLGAFQGNVLEDNDPNNENQVLGTTPSDGRGGSLVFYEVHVDNKYLLIVEQDTVNHELVHNFGAVDLPGETTDGSGNFTPKALSLIRSSAIPACKR